MLLDPLMTSFKLLTLTLIVAKLEKLVSWLSVPLACSTAHLSLPFLQYYTCLFLFHINYLLFSDIESHTFTVNQASRNVVMSVDCYWHVIVNAVFWIYIECHLACLVQAARCQLVFSNPQHDKHLILVFQELFA